MRNVLYAIGNSGDPSLADVAKARLEDASPLVRGAAVWALRRLLEPKEFATLARDDPNPEVREEWRVTPL